MAGLGTTLRNAHLDWYKGTTYPVVPADISLFLSLHSADPGITGASEVAGSLGYARSQGSMGNRATAWSALSDSGAARIMTNAGQITFGPASGAGFSCSFVGLWSAASAGTYYVGGSTTTQTMNAGESYQYAIGGVTMSVQ